MVAVFRVLGAVWFSKRSSANDEETEEKKGWSHCERKAENWGPCFDR